MSITKLQQCIYWFNT